MLKSIEVYLVTDGNGQEAVKFYQEALDAELVAFATFGDFMPDCPPELAHLVMNAQLRVNGIRLQVSDNHPMYAYAVGTNMTAALIPDDEATAKILYERLSVGAQDIQLPLQATPWSPAYASFVDQFGMHWQISAEVDGYVPQV